MIQIKYDPNTPEGTVFYKLATGLKHDIKNFELIESDEFDAGTMHHGFFGVMKVLWDLELRDWSNLSAQAWRNEPDLLRDLIKNMDITVYYAKGNRLSESFRDSFDNLRVYVSKNVDLMDDYSYKELALPLTGDYLRDSLISDINSSIPDLNEFSKALYLDSRMKSFGICELPAMSFFGEKPLVQGLDCFLKLGEILGTEKKRQALKFIEKTQGYPKPKEVMSFDYAYDVVAKSSTPDYGGIKKYFEELYIK